MHEDVAIETRDWGKIICGFLEKTTDCGVIGFAGGLSACRNCTSWGGGGDGVVNVYDEFNGKNDAYSKLNYKKHLFANPKNEAYSPAVCIDGLFQCVKKSIWAEIKYDEKNFAGFHFYDIDFSFAVSQKYTNYVLLTMDVFHDSPGHMNKHYIKNIFIFQNKWKNALPYYITQQAENLEATSVGKREVIKPHFVLRLKMARNELKEVIFIYKLCKEHAFSIAQFIKQTAALNGIFFIPLFYTYYVVRKIAQLLIRILEKI